VGCLSVREGQGEEMRSFARSSPAAKRWKNKKKELKQRRAAGKFLNDDHYWAVRRMEWEYHQANIHIWNEGLFKLPEGVECSLFCQRATGGVLCKCACGGVGHGAVHGGVAVDYVQVAGKWKRVTPYPIGHPKEFEVLDAYARG